MGAFAWMHGALDALHDAPGVWHLRRASAERKFAANTRSNLFRGVFDSAEAALASAPKTRPLSYDNADSAELYLRRLKIDDYDHPSMFWLQNGFQAGLRSVVDLGGSVGIKYFAFSPFIDFPADLRWRVIDMPAVARRGREFAASRGAPSHLSFSDDVADIDGIDMLFVSGTLQYLPQTLDQILASLARKPRRIVVNTTAIHPTRDFFTLNSIGTAFCAYRVQSRDRFVDSVLAQGYTLRDEWRNIGKQLRLPFSPGHGLEDYKGFCFEASA
ncbi:MAG: methyltransferase, TIGR04325 family [Burkholderiaceae bacterium]|nr:MAG: methyltransferase, TIGR04325 family [Burkholderiaceae bacterium]